jgi:hypothetical protein
MSLQTFSQTLITSQVDGPTLTAAAAATCIPAAAKYTLPNNFFSIGTSLRITAQGRISCVVTTPGTARFDVRLGGSAIVVFDTGALNLNIVAKTTVPWWLDIVLTCRAIGSGTTANLFGFGRFTSEAVIASPTGAAGGNGTLVSSVATGPDAAPAVGAGFDSTAANVVDLFFTQTVATGSLTVHQYVLESLN